jgi:hypothetical protein
VFGREHAQILRVDAWEPGALLVTSARESGAAYTATHHLSGRGTETDVEVRFEVEPTNLGGRAVHRLFGRRLMRSVREAMEQDLSDLAAAASRGRAQ